MYSSRVVGGGVHCTPAQLQQETVISFSAIQCKGSTSSTAAVLQLKQETVQEIFEAEHCSRRLWFHFYIAPVHLHSCRRRLWFDLCNMYIARVVGGIAQCTVYLYTCTAEAGDCDLMQMSAPSNIFLSCPVLILLLKPFTFFSHHFYTSLLTATEKPRFVNCTQLAKALADITANPSIYIVQQSIDVWIAHNLRKLQELCTMQLRAIVLYACAIVLYARAIVHTLHMQKPWRTQIWPRHHMRPRNIHSSVKHL